MKRPDLLLPDAASLLVLGELGLLDLLPSMANRLVLVDLVQMDLEHRAPDIAVPVLAWLHDQADRIQLGVTPSGETLRRLWHYEPAYWPSDGALTAIAEWLADAVMEADTDLLVLTDNLRLHEIASIRGPDADIDVMGLHGLLELAEAQGLVASATDRLIGCSLQQRVTHRRRR
ncbi:hypothetical protein HN018_28285 (plasmid) [Lichenicola cladoniae]|uniref:DUF3368 domain-containing protein n=1 Tax=Lichenicola cladoniae TaxID=1484109 RepID=A0A6M8I1Z1_9PROT|nr:hypothetical protein [Lichenicola cladoniae]NPD69794.1 hypothetical protein [Acetobacteraceae bacterium]QKE94025.1 hypothetical protein HN018_28285 [Lichenicola cladoniae]